MATIESLDTDIADLRVRVATLQAHHANLSSILLSQPHLPARLEQRHTMRGSKHREAANTVSKQSKRNLENVYRTCAGITAYKVKDPDPNAVDEGNVLGVRVDVSVGDQFVEAYHVLLNRPDASRKNVLGIHKHTVPPCIPLQALAKKWLPTTRKSADTSVEQNLIKFGRSLRKELVSWHLRQKAVEKLRQEANVVDNSDRRDVNSGEPAAGKVLNAFVSDDDDSDDDAEHHRARTGPIKITMIEADAAVREITVIWSNRSTGVAKVTRDGVVEKAVVRGEDGKRDAALERKAIGRIEGFVQRLNI